MSRLVDDEAANVAAFINDDDDDWGGAADVHVDDEADDDVEEDDGVIVVVVDVEVDVVVRKAIYVSMSCLAASTLSGKPVISNTGSLSRLGVII